MLNPNQIHEELNENIVNLIDLSDQNDIKRKLSLFNTADTNSFNIVNEIYKLSLPLLIFYGPTKLAPLIRKYV